MPPTKKQRERLKRSSISRTTSATNADEEEEDPEIEEALDNKLVA